MIPKILHQIWVGDKPKDVQYENWTNKLKTLHPGWTYYFWHNGNIDEFGINELLKDCQNESSKSNIIRIHAVKSYGGIYCDMDIEPLRSFEPLLGNKAFVGWEVPGRVCSALFGAIPSHPWLIRMVEAVPAWIGRESPWGPSLFSENLSDVTVYPVDYFYPYLWHDEPRPAIDSYTIHHWHRTWRR